MAGTATKIKDISNRMNDLTAEAHSMLRQVIVPAASKTLLREESGAIVIIETDALVMTLPLTTNAPGMYFTFVNGGADGACIITVSPNSADGIEGEIANSAQDSHPGGVNDKDIVNTKATAIKGDRVTVVSDGTGDWYVLEGVGIWATEA